MKVLVLACATYADPSTRRLFDHIATRGVEVLLAMPRRVKHPFAPAEVPETPWPTPGVRLELLDTWYLHENGTHILMKGIPRIIRDFQPDVIHCVMEPWSLTCLQVLATLPLLPRRPRFGVQACETKPAQGGFVARAIRRRLYRSVLSRCDYFIGWSGPVITAARGLGLNGIPSWISPAVGVDTELFRPASAEEKIRARAQLALGEADDFVAGFVGRLVLEKGITDLLDAADLAAPDIPRFRLVVIGTGPLSAHISTSAGTRPWLFLRGPLSRTDLASHLRALDLLVVPSRTTPAWEEQFGLVLPEAMASGVPAIGTLSGAIPEVIGNTGWLLEASDSAALAEALRTVATTMPVVSSRGAVARDRALRDFSSRAVADVLSDAWGRVV